MASKPIKTNDSGTRNKERGKTGHAAPGKNSSPPRKGRQHLPDNDDENRPEEQVSGHYNAQSASAWQDPEEEYYTDEDDYYDNHGRTKGRRRRY